MTIFCATCHKPIQSTKESDQIQDVIEQMSRHLTLHPEEAKTLAHQIGVFSSYLLLRHGTIPPEAEPLRDLFEEYEEELLSLLGELLPPEQLK